MVVWYSRVCFGFQTWHLWASENSLTVKKWTFIRTLLFGSNKAFYHLYNKKKRMMQLAFYEWSKKWATPYIFVRKKQWEITLPSWKSCSFVVHELIDSLCSFFYKHIFHNFTDWEMIIWPFLQVITAYRKILYILYKIFTSSLPI